MHIRIANETISREQASMYFSNGRFFLTNHSTSNPTVLNGVPLKPGETLQISNETLIEMGDVRIRYIIL